MKIKSILIVLAFIISSCSSSNRNPDAWSNVVVTKGGSAPFEAVDDSYSFNNLEEIDTYTNGYASKENSSPRFRAINFLSDYKSIGYKVCPINGGENSFYEGFTSFTIKRFLENAYLGEEEADFFTYKAPVKVSRLGGLLKKLEYIKFNVIFPLKKSKELNERLWSSEVINQLGCKSCVDENISLAYMEMAEGDKNLLLVLTAQTQDSLEFSMATGSIKIIPSTKQCKDY